MKGKRDKTRTASDELRDGMLESEGLCVIEVLLSAPQGAACSEAHLKCKHKHTQYEE